MSELFKISQKYCRNGSFTTAWQIAYHLQAMSGIVSLQSAEPGASRQ